MMLHHNIKNSDHKKVVKQILAEETKNLLQKHYGLKSPTDDTISGSENNEIREHK